MAYPNPYSRPSHPSRPLNFRFGPRRRPAACAPVSVSERVRRGLVDAPGTLHILALVAEGHAARLDPDTDFLGISLLLLAGLHAARGDFDVRATVEAIEEDIAVHSMRARRGFGHDGDDAGSGFHGA